MKKKFSKEKTINILMIIGIVLAVFMTVGLIGSMFARDDGGDGVRVPSTNHPVIEDSEQPSDTEPAPVIKTVKFTGQGSGVTFEKDIEYEEGMTWAEWLVSDYNTSGVSENGWHLDDDGNVCYNDWSGGIDACEGFHTEYDCKCGEDHGAYDIGRPFGEVVCDIKGTELIESYPAYFWND